MFLVSTDGVLDFDLDLLTELLAAIDYQLDRIELQSEQFPDQDSAGHFDRMEGLVGLGFVACQQYIHATYAQLGAGSKAKALQSPPIHSCGRPVAELINAAANFWKHHDEWPTSNQSHEARIRATIDVLTASSADYVLTNVLHELLRPAPPRFAGLLERLSLWRDSFSTPSS
jgi:hypothetical protein